MGGKLCSADERENTIAITGRIDLGLTITSQSTMYLVLLITSGILLCGRTSKQRPCFVLCQVSLLWFSQFCFTTYNMLLALESTSAN